MKPKQTKRLEKDQHLDNVIEAGDTNFKEFLKKKNGKPKTDSKLSFKNIKKTVTLIKALKEESLDDTTVINLGLQAQ